MEPSLPRVVAIDGAVDMKWISWCLLAAVALGALPGCTDSVGSGSGADGTYIAADAQVDWPFGFDGSDDAQTDMGLTDNGQVDLGGPDSPDFPPPPDTGDLTEDAVPIPCADHSQPDGCEADPECRWLVPGCMDEFDPNVLETAGCYPLLDCGGGDCPDGTICSNRVINPCWNAPCGVCASEAHVCLPAAIMCGGDELSAGLIVGTSREPTEVSGSVSDYQLEGTVTYFGTPTTTSPIPGPFDREVRIEHDDGTVSWLQIHLPLGLELPVAVDQYFIFTYRHVQFFEGQARGLVISRPTSGLHPLLFVLEVGGSRHGRVFADEEGMLSPLKVYQVEEESCPSRPDPSCGGDIYADALVFDSSTGAAMRSVRLFQGQWATLPIHGDGFTVVNLASTRIEPTCPDDLGGHTAFLALRQPAGAVACWDTTDCDDSQSCQREGVCLPPPGGCEEGCEPVCYGICE